MICGECGKPYRRATWTKTKGKRIVWRCFNRQESGSKYCHESPAIDEYSIHDTIMNAVNLLIDDKGEFITTLTSNVYYKDYRPTYEENSVVAANINTLDQTIRKNWIANFL